MATSVVPTSMARHEIQEPVLPSPGTPDSHESEATEGSGSTGDDDDEEEEQLYGDREDAQSFIQPSISRAATRLTSPKTPAAEKVAAMDELIDGFFGGSDEAAPAPAAKPPVPAQPPAPISAPDHPRKPDVANLHLDSTPSAYEFQAVLPTPWHAGPKELVVAGPGNAKPALAGVFGQSSSRPRRSSSVGQEALRRLSKALPSISIPSGLMSSFPTPSFFSSSSSSPKATGAQSPMRSASPAIRTRNSSAQVRPASVAIPVGSRPAVAQGQPAAVLASLPEASRRSLTLHKSPSDDSLLYHSLSRVSSFGDDARFENIREQVNSRFKAIKDSFPERPTFKMPPMPSTFQSLSHYASLLMTSPFSLTHVLHASLAIGKFISIAAGIILMCCRHFPKESWSGRPGACELRHPQRGSQEPGHVPAGDVST